MQKGKLGAVYEGSGKYCFITYQKEDTEAIRPIMKILQKKYRFWYDSGAVSGRDWPEVVARKIGNAGVFLIFLSKRTMSSGTVRREIHYAAGRDVTIICVYLEECEISAGLAMQTETATVIRRHLLKSDKDAANEIMKVLQGMKELSPTAINRYLRCPLEFYYNMVVGIKEPEDNDEDEIDNRIFGNIFHAAAQSLYTPYIGREIKKDQIQALLEDKRKLNKVVDDAFQQELFHAVGRSYQPRYNGLQTINKNVIIRYLERLLTIDGKLESFTVLGLEQKADSDLSYNTSEGTGTIRVGGFIDRLDRITDQEGERIRVIDYKTGKLPQMKTNGVEDIFDINNRQKRHADYYLQTFLYALNVRDSKAFDPKGYPVSPALLFIQHTQGDNYDPTLFIGKDKVADVLGYKEEYQAKLQQTLSDIFEPQRSFAPTDDKSHCLNCPYRQVCGI